MGKLSPYHIKGLVEAGCDEAGRGCLAGPVVAAAVILPEGWDPGLNDSKQLSEKKRDALRVEIEEKAECWGVGIVSPEEIDEINILNASFLAMHRALDQLTTTPESILVDGNRFNPYKDISYHCMIKGDGRFLSIAAASVLAKTHRDELMYKAHEQHPVYNWKKNKGYPTVEHRDAIRKYGVTELHRNSFKLLPEQLSLDFFD